MSSTQGMEGRSKLIRPGQEQGARHTECETPPPPEGAGAVLGLWGPWLCHYHKPWPFDGCPSCWHLSYAQSQPTGTALGTVPLT